MGWQFWFWFCSPVAMAIPSEVTIIIERINIRGSKVVLVELVFNLFPDAVTVAVALAVAVAVVLVVAFEVAVVSVGVSQMVAAIFAVIARRVQLICGRANRIERLGKEGISFVHYVAVRN